MKIIKKAGSAFEKKPEIESTKNKKLKIVPKVKLFKKPILIWIFIALFGAIGIGNGIYFYYQYHNSQQDLNDSVLGTQIETEKTLEKIAKMIELPAEQPTIATVADVTKLKNQPFFLNAKNGDKVLIFQKAKKAILYRPSTNKIIEFGPINLGSIVNDAEITPSSADSYKPVSIAIYNGTNIVGLANSIDKQLKSRDKNLFNVIEKGNASRSDYTDTIVIDVNGDNSKEAEKIASFLSGTVGSLPVGEQATSSADIVIIVGKNSN